MKNNDKKKSTLLKDAFALFLITLIAGLALSYVYEITKSPISEQREQKKIEAYQKAYKDAVEFTVDEELTKLAADTDLKTLNKNYQGSAIDEISKAYDSNGDMLGYLIKVSTKKGYNKSTPIELAIAYSLDKTVKGIDIITIKETVNLGMEAAEPEFKDQFAEKTVDQFEVVKSGASADHQIDAISGATITSKAVSDAVNAGIGFITENNAELGGGADE